MALAVLVLCVVIGAVALIIADGRIALKTLLEHTALLLAIIYYLLATSNQAAVYQERAGGFAARERNRQAGDKAAGEKIK